MENMTGLVFWFKRAVLPCCLALALSGAVSGAGRDGSAKELEDKAEGAISGLLGPGRAKVMVRVEEEGAGPSSARLTAVIALSDSVTDVEARKARSAVSDLLGVNAGGGGEVLVMKTGFASGPEKPASSGGLMDYAYQGLLVLVGMVIALIFSHARKSVVDEKAVTARRAPMSEAQREKYVPPPVQPQAANPESDELNIPSRSGFYKR